MNPKSGTVFNAPGVQFLTLCLRYVFPYLGLIVQCFEKSIENPGGHIGSVVQFVTFSSLGALSSNIT